CLGERGARVVVNYRSRADAAGEVVSAIEAAGGTAIAVQADVASGDGAAQLGEAALEQWGRVDVVVNNATPAIVRKPLDETEWDDTPATRRRALVLQVPAQRLPSPEEVAATVMFLVGKEGASLTGANLPVAGGEVMQ